MRVVELPFEIGRGYSQNKAVHGAGEEPMLIKNYWRLAPSALPTGSPQFDRMDLVGPEALVSQLRPATGLLFGEWNESEQIGSVSALGICTKRTADSVQVDWREVDIRLRPNPSGRTHWRVKATFRFAASVVDRYGLADLFAERFPELEEADFSGAPVTNASCRLPSVAIPGYVYLIRSPYGFKIGKTVNIKSRTRLFEVKLPFPISVEHFSWFDDYSRAERELHGIFHGKRLEGEWFDLTPNDIAHIKTLGRPASAEELRAL